MIRMSVTELETWRYWKNQEDPDPEKLIAELSRRVEPTPQMEAGRALAKLFENVPRYAPDGELYAADVDGWTFDFGALDHDFAVPPFREVKAEVVIDTPAGPVTLVGKVDGLDARVVHDEKLTERWDAEKYLDSLQWRSYLLMFGADKFVYDVFLASYKKKNDEIVRGGPVTIRDYNALPFYRYPGMDGDVRLAVAELADVIRVHVPERVLP